MNYEPKDLKYVGTRPIRPDGADKVTGRANFGADHTMPGMLHGATVRSKVARGLLKAINLAPENYRLVIIHARFLYQDDPSAAGQIATDPLGPLPEGMDPTEMAAWTNVCNVILNLDDCTVR